MEGVGIQFVVMLVFGGICAAIASSKGRSPVGWFFVGMFGGCIGLILILVLSDLKKAEARHQRLQTENRRLREKLDKDRMVADRRFVETNRRLEVHDVALDIDTGARIEEGARPELEASEERPPDLDPPPAGNKMSPHYGKQWYYAMDSQESPPLSFAGLRRLWQKGQLDATTLVWSTGMSDWRSIGDIDGLEDELRV